MDLLVRIPLFPVATAIAKNSSITSSPVDTQRFQRLESLNIILNTAVATPRVKIDYATSEDNVTYGSYGNDGNILADSNTLTNPKESHALSLPNVLSRYVKFRFTELNVDSDVTAIAVLYARENLRA